MKDMYLESWKDIYPKNIPPKNVLVVRSENSVSTDIHNPNFKVFIRLHPLCTNDITMKADEFGIVNTINKFKFSGVFTKNDSSTRIYNKTIGHVLSDEKQSNNNITLFCYGATGTGKTYTLLDEQNGLLHMTALDQIKFPVKISCIQIYKEVVTSLYHKDTPSSCLNLNSRSNIDFQPLENIKIKVYSVKELIKYIKIGSENRVTHQTDFNSASSRSHMIFTFYDTQRQVNFVDLAGSEKYTTQDLEETTSINKSLLALGRVVSCLCKKSSHVPYRDSQLTMFLRNSLGGNCVTILLSTIGGNDVVEIQRTLKFAAKASFIENRVKNNEKRPLIKEEIEKRGNKFNISFRLKKEEDRLYSLDGVWIHIIGHDCLETASLVVILLHGAPGSSTFFTDDWLKFKKHEVYGIAIDMPGYGLSDKLTRLPSHSSNNLDKDGPVDIVNQVMNAFCLHKVSILGYDWGGGIALSMAEQFPSKVNSLVVYHAMTHADKFKLKCKTTLLWVKSDQFHPVKLGRILKTKTNGILHEFDVGRFKTDYDACYYCCHDKLVPCALEGLKMNLTKKCENKEDIPNEEGYGQKNKQLHGIFKKITLETIESNLHINTVKWVRLFKTCFHQQFLPHIYGIYLGKIPHHDQFRPACLKLFGQLPSLYDFHGKLTANKLAEWGIWSESYSTAIHNDFSNIERSCTKNFDSVLTNDGSLEYFYKSGRYVFFKGSGISNRASDLCTMKNNSDTLGNLPGYNESFRGIGLLGQKDQKDKTYNVLTKCNDLESVKQIKVSEEMLWEQNNPTWLKCINSKLCLEDGIKASYDSFLMKARLLELMFLIEDCKTQKEMVKKVELMMNMTCLYEGLDIFRYCRSEDPAKLSTYGTGHCHGLTSVFASLLYPFQHLLGIYMRYTGGFHVKRTNKSNDMELEDDDDMEISNSVEHHQWLELTFYPSFQLNIVDLVQAVAEKNYICFPTMDAYSDPKNILYGNGKLIINSYI